MPIKIKKVDGYRVSTPYGVKAKETTKAKAESQKRLLNAVEHGWKPTGKKNRVHCKKVDFHFFGTHNRLPIAK